MVDKEIEFVNGINFLKNKYGKAFYDWYWTPSPIIDGLPVKYDKIIRKLQNHKEFIKDVEVLRKVLQNPKKHYLDEVMEYDVNLIRIIKKYNFQFEKNLSEDELLKQKYALFRYEVIGALNNISLSVYPSIKKKWKINFELFGSFYNTHYDYCGLYPDLEKCKCDFFSFLPKPGMIILINPPYTCDWINLSAKKLDEYLKTNNLKIYYVVPIWNSSDRKKLGLSEECDMPILDEIKKNKFLVSHKIENLDFYNGIQKKHVKLKDFVDIYFFDSNHK